MRKSRQNPIRARHGITLIELLVVVFIILAVSAAIVPVIAPTAAGRRQREAARTVSTFLSSARSNAIQSGRPAGVWLEGINGDPATVLSLAYCEVPEPYSGDAPNTKLMYNVVNDRLQVTDIAVWDSTGSTWVTIAPVGLIRRGDLVSLNNRPTTFRITGGTLDSYGFLADPRTDPWILFPTNPAMMGHDGSGNLIFPSAPNTGSAGDGVPFKIIRQPQKSGASTAELPAGTTLDLYYSGDVLPLRPKSDNTNDYLVSDAAGNGVDSRTEPIIILFDAAGSPDSVFRFTPNNDPPTAPADLDWGAISMTRPLYLLVGKSEKVGLELNPVPALDEVLELDDDLTPNLIDPDNYWISVSPINGTISTDEVATVSLMPANMAQLVQQSRQFAVEKLGIGGR